MMHRIAGIIVLLLICTSCGNSPPRSLIPEEQLIPILVDFHLTYSIQQSPDFYRQIKPYDSIDVYSYIFEKHGFTKAEFDTTISWYLKNPEYYVEMYDEVIMNLTRMKDSLGPQLKGR